MWADNETDLDLLGFDVLVDELVVALTEPRLLPLTVGVLGGWGSGKSSLLKIVRSELEAVDDQPYVCVDFSPWQYEDYGDVKAGLMRAVLEHCQPRATGAAQQQAAKLSRFSTRFASRARRLARTATLTAPAFAPALVGLVDPDTAASTVEAAKAAAGLTATVVGGALEQNSDQPSPADEIRDVEDFRKTFEAFVRDLDGVEAVVVFIDDLDRCLPDTVVDTFEAIRLFLNVPGAAYVVAASREIVETAIDSRYPELVREDGRGIGHQYLEKMLQLQVSVPPLSAAEAETYVNLLVSELHVDKDQFWPACAALRERGTDPFAPSYNATVAAELLGPAFTTALADDMAWATEITPALAGLGGNPRRIKRFLNDLTWRRRAAKRRGVELRHDVLAKLMVLEDQNSADFQTLFDWQIRADGPSPELVLAETLARDEPVPDDDMVDADGKADDNEAVPRSGRRPAKKTGTETNRDGAAIDIDPVRELATGWAGRPTTRAWLRLQPDLREVDLRRYFLYFRDRLVIGAAASKLRPDLQVLLGKLLSDVPLVARKALTDLEAAPTGDQDDVVLALLDTVARRPDGPALYASCEVAARLKRVAGPVCDSLSRLPHRSLTLPMVVGVAKRLVTVSEREDLFAGWRASPVETLAKAAVAATRPKATG